MNELENKLRDLKLKNALILSQIYSLTEVDETLFTQLGKVVAEISQLEKQLLREVENVFE